jgi:aspartate-semialdehyde dehydrogenase
VSAVGIPCSIIGFGAVGKLLYRVGKERRLPVEAPRVYARSARTEAYDGDQVAVRALDESAFERGGIILFAGTEGEKSASEVWAPVAIERGGWVIDNSATFRMREDVPLVVPEVNPHHITASTRLIANPNCSTIQMVAALAPLHRAVGIRRVVVSTYQSVSGSGAYGMDVLAKEAASALAGAPMRVEDSPFSAQIAFNCVPFISSVDETGYTGEEQKMVKETRKILDAPAMRVSATTVRVGTRIGHAECVNVELEAPLSAAEARRLLAETPGIVVVDEPELFRAPTPLDVEGRDEVFVGRIRQDTSVEHGLDLWIVADNLRKGAATNAVQIAELLIERGYLTA